MQKKNAGAGRWDTLLAIADKAKPPRRKTIVPGSVDRLISQLTRWDDTRANLFKSGDFRAALESILALPKRDMRRRLIQLLNILTAQSAIVAQAEFPAQRRGSLKKRTEKATKHLLAAAKEMGTRYKFLPLSSQHSPFTAGGILILEAAGDIGDAIYTIAMAIEAAADQSKDDDGYMHVLGFNARNIPQAGVKATQPEKAVVGFLCREISEALSAIPSNERRWAIASRLLTLSGFPISQKTIRSFARRGH